MKLNCFFSIACIGLSSCSQFISVDHPQNQVVADEVFGNDASALSALYGLYAEAMFSNNNLINGGLSAYSGLSADELDLRFIIDTQDEFRQNEIQPANSDNEFQFWRKGYSLIHQANAVAEGSFTGSLSVEVEKTIRGEALFLRALCYFYLTNLYGAVPLIRSTDYRENKLAERSPIPYVYGAIEEDLLMAEELLAEEYPVANRARPNRAAVRALLARLYLYQRQWEKAMTYSSLVIGDSRYGLEENLSDVFRYDSEEVLWQLYPVNNSFKATSEAQVFLPTSRETSLPLMLMSAPLLNRFEPGDARRIHWVGSKEFRDVTYLFPCKYKIRSGSDFREEYNVMLRLAEQYLIRAEARAEVGRMQEAWDDLNLIRSRAGLPNASSPSADDFFETLRRERSIELFAEHGHRWLDLKRWELAHSLLGPLKGAGWQSTDIYYPIPLYELESNPSIVQNEGY